MVDWLTRNWPLVLVVETALLVWSLSRPKPNWRRLVTNRHNSRVLYGLGRLDGARYSDSAARAKGTIARVDLRSSSANVRLLDAPNFARMKKGKRYAFVGGHYTESPIDLVVPWTGKWRVVVDLGGEPGRVTAGLSWVEGRLPPAQAQPHGPARRLAPLRRTPREYEAQEERRDVFISHANEDKDEVARPLADALIALGVSVWLDEYELKIGDSLWRKIDQAVARSRFGVAVLSPDFFKKGWTRLELAGLVAKGVHENRQSILPVYHRGFTHKEILTESPSLSDLVARDTGHSSIEDIAAEIAAVVKPQEQLRDDDDERRSGLDGCPGGRRLET